MKYRARRRQRSVDDFFYGRVNEAGTDLAASLLDQMTGPDDAEVARFAVSVEFGTLLASAIPLEADTSPPHDPASYRFRLTQPEMQPSDEELLEAIRVSSLYFVLRPTRDRHRATAAIRFADRSGAGARVRLAAPSLANALAAGQYFVPMLELFEESLFGAPAMRTDNRDVEIASETGDLYSAGWKAFTESLGWEAFDPHGYWMIPSLGSSASGAVGWREQM
jgi:hypothetical protein